MTDIATVTSYRHIAFPSGAATLASPLRCLDRSLRSGWCRGARGGPDLRRCVCRTCGGCWWGEAFWLEAHRSNGLSALHEAHGGSCSSRQTIANGYFAFQDFLLMFDGISVLPQTAETPEALRRCELGFQTSARHWHFAVIFTCFSSRSFPFEFFFMCSGTMTYRSASS